MENVKYLITVTRRAFAEDYTDFFGRHGIKHTERVFCKGTATDKALEILGMERTEKVMFLSVATKAVAQEIKKGLITEMDIRKAGNGIHIVVPLDGIGGGYSKNYLLGDGNIEREDKAMEEKSRFVLLIVIADKGNVETVMEAARGAGASGGTVVSAKGTGKDIAKFFGVAISEEKELIHIVAEREKRDAIMKAIMEKAGRDTSAHGVVFSIPVEEVVGVRAFE